MPESEEESHDFPSKSKTLEEHEFAMDFDIDLENSWPLDHLSEQPISPIWTVSDVEDNKHASISASGFLFSNFLRSLYICYCVF